MFTGLIERVSKIEDIIFSSNGARISYCADFENVKIGDSIAINGVCLTVVLINGHVFSSDIMLETLNSSNFKQAKKGDEINLERALRLSDRLDGHIVSGHIDTTSSVCDIKQEGFSKKIHFKCDSSLIIKKGSIAINGVSLTVCEVNSEGFCVSLIPQTIENTNLKNIKIGDIVNIEYDVLGKYIKKFLTVQNNNENSKITFEFLKQNGF